LFSSDPTVVVMTLELDGFLWKPKPGTAVTAEEFTRARSVMQDIHRTVEWNPWAQDDRADEYAAALEIIGQWTRAEPGYRAQSAEELRSMIDRRVAIDMARLDAERQRAKQDRAQRAARYDRKRDTARLALLGQTAILTGKTRKRDQLASRELYPAMEDERRRTELAKLVLDIKAAARAVDELTAVVGDVEAVWDERGWHPSERRALALEVFAERRVNEVRELRGRVAADRPDLNAVRGRPGRARIGEALLRDTARLRFLEVIPALDADDMCSECPTPAAWHSLSVTFNLDPSEDVGSVDGPCPAWPWWRERQEETRQELLAITLRKGEPPVAVRMPIDVIDSDLPIEEVVVRLNAVQADHPGAQVRRGSGNRWEIWPPDET
jgi:hypothetical protein